MAIQLNFKCNESWEKMSLSTNGRFCDNCSKNVFDLTDKSDTEIRQLYADNKGKMCGRIKQSQIGIPFMSEQKRMLAKFCLALYMVFGSFIFSNTLNAQNVVSNNTHTVDALDSLYVIKGKVIEEHSNEPIPFVSVYFEYEDKEIGTVTDLDGNFVLEFNKNTIKSAFINLIIRSLGYEDLIINNIKLDDNSLVILDAKMKMAEIELLGDIMIEEHPVIKDPEHQGETIIKREDIKRSPY